MQLQIDPIGSAFPEQPVEESAEVAVQFAPGLTLSSAGGSSTLVRGCFTSKPNDAAASAWANNPSDIAIMFGEVIAEFGLVGSSDILGSLKVNPVVEPMGEDVAEPAGAIWKRVVHQPFDPDRLVALRDAVGDTRRSRSTGAYRWAALHLPAETNPGIQPLEPIVPPGDVAIAGLSIIERALLDLHTANVLTQAKSGTAEAPIDMRGFLRNFAFSEQISSGLASLLNGEASAEWKKRRGQELAAAIRGRGLEHGLRSTEVGNNALAGEGELAASPFHRFEPDPGPDTRASKGLEELLAGMVGDIAVNSWFAANASDTVRGPAEWGQVISQMLESKLTGKNLSNVFIPDQWQSIDEEIAQETAKILTLTQLALRPDLYQRRQATPTHVQANLKRSFSQLDLDDAHYILAMSDSRIQRRIGGLMALPVAARVAGLVHDVDLDLGQIANPQLQQAFANGGEFWIRIVPQKVGLSSTIDAQEPRTVCRLVQPSAKSVGTQNLPLFVAAERPLKSARRHVDGVLDLTQQIKIPLTQGGTVTKSMPRYTLNSVDLAGLANRMWNEAETEAESQMSGRSERPESAGLRTSGIALYDVASDWVAQQAIAASVTTDELRYASDIVTGYRVDVGVSPRNGGSAPTEWRSLCVKTVEYDNSGNVPRLKHAAQHVRSKLSQGTGMQTQLLDDLLHETIVRPGARLIEDERDDGQTKQQALMFDSIFEWTGDPIAAACLSPKAGETDQAHEHQGEGEVTTDAVVMFTENLPRIGPRPPRLEVQRDYRFGMRAVFLGGYSLPVSEAAKIYNRPADSPTLDFTHLRMENIAAPLVHYLDENTGRGESVTTMAVRNTSHKGEQSRRILTVPSVPLELASMHPTLETLNGTRKPSEPIRVLDKRNCMDGKRRHPAGGLANVTSLNAAEHVRQPERMETDFARAAKGAPEHEPRQRKPFKVGKVPKRDFIARPAQYYPDPMVDRIRVELFDPSLPDSPVVWYDVPVYDRNFRQAVPRYIHPRLYERCEYPNAIPLLIDLRRTAGEARFQLVTGCIDEDGKFDRLRPREVPQANTITVQRLEVHIPPGSDLELRCTCLRNESYNAGFGPRALGNRLCWNTGLASRADNDPVRQIFSGNDELRRLDALGCDSTNLRVVHAVQVPKKPLLDSPSLLRRQVETEEWLERATEFMNNPVRETVLEDALTWPGGTMKVEAATTGNIALSVAYSDLRYDPRKPITVNRDGSIQYQRLSLDPATIRLRRDVTDYPDGQRSVDLVEAGLVDRPITLNLPDSRAYELEITPVAGSRFAAFFPSSFSNEQLSRKGKTRTVWAMATRRPASLGFVEMLPAFVWTEQSGTASISRRMVARLMWRNPEIGPAGDNEQEIDAKNAWPSSGKNEQLAFLAHGTTSAVELEPYTSRIGSDAIRKGAEPKHPIDLATFLNFEGKVAQDVFVPLPGKVDAKEKPLTVADGERLNLLPVTPRYNPQDRYWYVDLDLGNPDKFPSPATIGAPWVRLGLARYQEHALHRDDEFSDLRASSPSVIEFRLEPHRRVDVTVQQPFGKGKARRWPITIVVHGEPQAFRGQGEETEYTSSKFRLTLLRTPYTLVDRFAEGGEERLDYELASKQDPVKNGEIYRKTILVNDNPIRFRHHILIEEIELMLDAHATQKKPGKKVETGPRFIAKVRIVE